MDILTIPQLAVIIGRTTAAITRHCRLGNLPAQKRGTQWLVDRADGEAFVATFPRPVGAPAHRKRRKPATISA